MKKKVYVLAFPLIIGGKKYSSVCNVNSRCCTHPLWNVLTEILLINQSESLKVAP